MVHRMAALLLAVCAGCHEEEPVVELAAQAIVVDPGCASTSLRLYDELGWRGRSLCFDSGGTADLASHCRITLGGGCYSTWEGAVRSYRSGDTGGRFGLASEPACAVDAGPGAYFGTYEWAFQAGPCEQGARYVTLDGR